MTRQPTEVVFFPQFVDERGALLPVEFDQVPFPVRRVFLVRGAPAPLPRGRHFVGCDELVVLISGSARVQVGAGPGDLDAPLVLDTVGQAIWLTTGTYLVYTLGDHESAILVLASEPYRGRHEGGQR